MNKIKTEVFRDGRQLKAQELFYTQTHIAAYGQQVVSAVYGRQVIMT